MEIDLNLVGRAWTSQIYFVDNEEYVICELLNVVSYCLVLCAYFFHVLKMKKCFWKFYTHCDTAVI